ncbi:prepilin-type N-terminal cleavage/methylation domain-containing protein [Desulfobaculum xiamenense]|uniref:Prepilin-type N-terminal cleavage/methylation domain-containing protein n=1 Tax=Desulfobaculum xiamenense TaxID=995050 RepID=A0A846QL09_9BACT|nr:prepilin-type N-terminal cleavage/methylation domain-containing protein [Desulfobaculum xiamenense]NJB67867.1 prepilin-type N-terminal cleavage/methylation domain-containing protein [Desulfobaculum xiamenense]
MEKRVVKGFTLVEMAIVLVIIGIILAGVMKGRDIVRGSQVKQFSQGFAQKWMTIATTYMDKTGQALADGTANGGTAANANGYMDNLFMGTNNLTQYDEVLNATRDVGIEPCTMIKTDLANDTNNNCPNGYNVFMRNVEGETSGKSRVVVGFYAEQIGANGPFRNIVVLQNVPSDVAQGLDTLIDGQADSANGACVGIASATTEVINAANAALGTGGALTLLTSYPSANSANKYVVVGLVLDY